MEEKLTAEMLKQRRIELTAELERILATANWLQGRIAQLDELLEQVSSVALKEEEKEKREDG